MSMPTQVTIHEAETELSALIYRVQSGEEIIIAEGGKPVARLVSAHPSAGDRVPGSAQGRFVVPDNFNDALPNDLLDEFEK